MLSTNSFPKRSVYAKRESRCHSLLFSLTTLPTSEQPVGGIEQRYDQLACGARLPLLASNRQTSPEGWILYGACAVLRSRPLIPHVFCWEPSRASCELWRFTRCPSLWEHGRKVVKYVFTSPYAQNGAIVKQLCAILNSFTRRGRVAYQTVVHSRAGAVTLRGCCVAALALPQYLPWKSTPSTNELEISAPRLPLPGAVRSNVFSQRCVPL
jgi:hypothetical protein